MTDEMMLRTEREQHEKDYQTWLDSLADEISERAYMDRMLERLANEDDDEAQPPQ